MGIRVPRITVSADFGDDRSIGDLSVVSVGYGLHQAWVYATMFGTASVFGTRNYVEGLYGNSIAMPYVVSILVYVACLIAGAVSSRTRFQAIYSRRTLAAGSLLMCAGTLLLLAAAAANMAALEALSGFLTGIGSAVLILQWGAQFARLDRASIILNTAIAASISVAVYAVCLHYLPYPAPGLLAAAIPLLEWAILRKRVRTFEADASAPRFKNLPIRYGKFVWRFGAPVFVFGLALGMLRQSSVKNITAAATFNDQILMLLGGALATVLILVTIIALGDDGRWSSLFRPLVPFVAVVLFLVMFADMFEQPFTNMLLISAFLCFEALMWIFFGDLSQSFRLSPAFVFGIGRGFLALAMLLGSLFPVIIAYWPLVNALGKPTMIVVILLVMVVAYALLPHEREIEAIVVPCPLVKMVSMSLEEKTLLPGELARALARVSEPAPAPAPASEPEPGFEPEPELAPASDFEPPATSEAGSAPSEARRAMSMTPSERGDIASAEAPGGAEGASDDEMTESFRAKCAMVSNRYLLSRREAEIMTYLARGYNAASVQEKLFIAEGTAKTHIRHIYRKLDIHSQQELIRMVYDAG